jgi:hypothetical protein
MNSDDAKVRRLAEDGLADLTNGDGLRSAIEAAAKIAAIRGHAAEEVWLRLQLIDLPDSASTPTEVPEDIERLWNAIDANPMLDAPAEVRLSTMRGHFESRSPAEHPTRSLPGT